MIAPLTRAEQRVIRLLENSDTDTDSDDSEPLVLLNPRNPLYSQWQDQAYIAAAMAEPEREQLMSDIRNHQRSGHLHDPDDDIAVMALYTLHDQGDIDRYELAMAISRVYHNEPDSDESVVGHADALA